MRTRYREWPTTAQDYIEDLVALKWAIRNRDLNGAEWDSNVEITGGPYLYSRERAGLNAFEIMVEGHPLIAMIHSADDLELTLRERVNLAYQGKYPGQTPPRWGDWRFLVSRDCFHHHVQRSRGKFPFVWEPVNGPPFVIEGGLFGNLEWQRYTPKHSGTLRAALPNMVEQEVIPPVYSDPMGSYFAFDRVPGIQGARDRALKEVLPQLGYGAKVPLFLKELADLKSVAKGCLQLCKLIGEFPFLVEMIKNYLLGKGDTLTGARAHLWTQFGLIPLVADLTKFHKTAMHLHRQIVDLERKLDKNLTVHCQEALRLSGRTSFRRGVIPILVDSVDAHPWVRNVTQAEDLYIDGRGHWVDEVQPKSAKYHLTAHYRFSLSPSFGKVNRLKLALDAFGVNWSPSQIWQAYPLSFVVDWFLGVSDVLKEHLDEPNVSFDVQIQQVCESVKYRYKRRVLTWAPIETVNPTVLNRAPGITLVSRRLNNQAEASLWDGSVYNRRVSNSLPKPSSRALTRLPSGMRWVTLGSLIRQRLG